MFSFRNLSNCSSFDDFTSEENQILHQEGYTTVTLAQKEYENQLEKIYNIVVDNIKFVAGYEQIIFYLDEHVYFIYFFKILQKDYEKINLSFEEIEIKESSQNDEQQNFQIIANFLNLALEIYTLNSSNKLEKKLTVASFRAKQKKPLALFKNRFNDYAPLLKQEKYDAIQISQQIFDDCFDWIFYPDHTKIQEVTVTLSNSQLLSISQILDKQQKSRKEQKLESFIYYEQLKPSEKENEFNLEKQKTINFEKQLFKPIQRTNSTDIYLNRRLKTNIQSSIEQIRKEIASYGENDFKDFVQENAEEDEDENNSNFSN